MRVLVAVLFLVACYALATWMLHLAAGPKPDLPEPTDLETE